ncbi:hypothetical protein FSP39_020802 [Pinctada imbricata]|uniref:Uncharacterized protein n=1 Tax=Pinctada imbricata TaxID=66713 RepID=A0AA89BXU2_PINIB|nr:hypothetical protein FSP39_020802 [Pinctada imbricata]
MGQLPPLDSHVWKCSLCSNILEDPQTLPCLHSFCSKCIDDAERGNICLYCKSKGDKELKAVPDFFLKNMIDYLRITEGNCEHKKCSFCQLSNKSTVAVSICITCLDFLCEECSKFHNMTRMTKDHEVKSLQDIHKGKHEEEIRSQQRVPCSTANTSLIFFCKTCNVLTCEECVFKEHMKHEVVKANEQSKEVREKVKIGLKTLSTSCGKMNAARMKEKNRLDETRKMKENLLQKIRLGKEYFIKEIEEQAVNAESQVEKLYKDPEGKLEKCFVFLDIEYSSLKHIYDRCSLVCEKANDVELLSLKDIISAKLRSDQLTEVPNEYISDLNTPSVSVSLGSALGRLFTVSENVPSVEPLVECSHPLPRQKSSDNDLKNSSSNSILLHEIGTCKIPSDKSEPIIADVCWLTDNSFVVGDTRNSVAKVFDDKNNFLWEIKAENITNVSCIGRFVICNSNRHLLVCQQGSIITNIDFGPFSSGPFPIAQGLEMRHILVANVYTTFMRVYTTEGLLKKTIILNATVNPICLRKSAECPIRFIDKTSKSVMDISNRGNVTAFYSKEDWEPKSMAVDRIKNVYVIDAKSMRLLKISEDGKLIFIKDLPMDEPVGLSINSANKCLVCEKTGKAYFFKS